MSYCNTCYSNTNCSSCLTGYNLNKNPDPVLDICECNPHSVLSGNCLKCSSPNQCIKCKDGYYLDDNNQCI